MLLSTEAQHIAGNCYIRKTAENFVLKQLFISLSCSEPASSWKGRSGRARDWAERKVWSQFRVICSCQNLYELNLTPGQALIMIIFTAEDCVAQGDKWWNIEQFTSHMPVPTNPTSTGWRWPLRGTRTWMQQSPSNPAGLNYCWLGSLLDKVTQQVTAKVPCWRHLPSCDKLSHPNPQTIFNVVIHTSSPQLCKVCFQSLHPAATAI